MDVIWVDRAHELLAAPPEAWLVAAVALSAVLAAWCGGFLAHAMDCRDHGWVAGLLATLGHEVVSFFVLPIWMVASIPGFVGPGMSVWPIIFGAIGGLVGSAKMVAPVTLAGGLIFPCIVWLEERFQSR